MKVLISFFLSFVIYILILLFLFFAFFYKKNFSNSQQVLVHTAIIPLPKNNIKNINIRKKRIVKKSVKSIGSKSNVSFSGKVNYKDIFENVKENIPTTPLLTQKREDISRLKGDFLKGLKIKTLKTINTKVIYSNNNYKKDKNIKKFIKQIQMIWNELSNRVGDYALIKLITLNDTIDVIILDSNLDLGTQKLLINRIKSLKINKNISVTIKFVTKVKND